MKKILNKVHLFAFVIALISMGACKQPGRKIIERFKDSTIAVVHEYPDRRDTSTYTYVEYYPKAGKVHARIPVVNNQIVNFPERYYPDGKVYERDSLFKPYDRYSDKWDGIISRFREDGKLWALFPVRDGIIQGNVTYFDTSGALLKRYSVVENQIKNGSYEEFYPNGRVSVRANFKNNLLDGMMYYFNVRGDTTKYCLYDSGEIYLPYKKWLDNGTTLVGEYADSSGKVVIWKWYSMDGKEIKHERKFSANKLFAAPE